MKCKIVVVGDGAAKKTNLLFSIFNIVNNREDTDYTPSVFDNRDIEIRVKDVNVCLKLVDTSGQEDLENIRILTYLYVDVFLFCFSVVEPESFKHIESRWLTEVCQYVDNPTILLVGTEKHLRNDESTLKDLMKYYQKPITQNEGEAKAAKIGAMGYLECSSYTREGVREVFEKAAEIALGPRLYQKKESCLVI